MHAQQQKSARKERPDAIVWFSIAIWTAIFLVIVLQLMGMSQAPVATNEERLLDQVTRVAVLLALLIWAGVLFILCQHFQATPPADRSDNPDQPSNG